MRMGDELMMRASVAVGGSALFLLSELRIVSVAIVLALITMTWELVTHWWSSPKPDRSEYDWSRQIGRKLITLSMIIPASVLDYIVIVASEHVRDIELAIGSYMPFTVGTLLWITVGQALQGLHNVRDVEGEDSVPGALLWALRQIRIRDDRRSPHDGAPKRRWWDDLTEEELESLLKARKGKEHKDG
jgi:hypothetical protein